MCGGLPALEVDADVQGILFALQLYSIREIVDLPRIIQMTFSKQEMIELIPIFWFVARLISAPHPSLFC
jgi:hypothetical protein